MKLKDSIIIILAVVIAVIVGVFVGFKLSENKNNNITNNGANNNQAEENNNSNNNIDDDEAEKDFSLAEAEKLMSKYKVGSCNSYIRTLTDEGDKLAAAVSSIKENDRVLCKDVYKNTEPDPGVYEGYYIGTLDNITGKSPELHCPDNYTKVYKYQDVLEAKKKLFGSSSVLAKEDTYAKSSNFGYLDYNADRDAFLTLQIGRRGDACYNVSILEVEKTGNNIKIYTKEIFEDEQYKREYIFKKENNNYYLAEINKLN